MQQCPATYLAAVPILAVLGLAVGAVRRRQPHPLSLLVLAALGALAALGGNQLVGHLYFRPRPYWALPAVHAIGARRGDSAFFSVHAAVAAALAAGLLLVARRWGLAAVGVALLVGLGQVATGANYPFDVLAGLAVGAACTAALLPLRHRTERLAGRLLRTPVTAPVHSGGSSAWESSPWCYSSGWAAGWSPASKTTGCASPSTAPTGD
jgi:membrane-associated phospholipid phosphatase